MKKILIGIAALFLIMAAIPAIVWLPSAVASVNPTREGGENNAENKKSPESGAEPSENEFLLLCADGSKKAISEKEALSGAVAAIIPQDCAEEAGYAIAAALCSRLRFLREGRSSGGAACELCEKGGDVPVCLSKEKACENFGNEFYAACEKYADYGLNTRLEYEGKTLDARIFKSCGGITDSAADLLDEKIPCHESVPSPWDMTYGIKSTTSYTSEEAKKIISEKFGIKNIPDSAADYIKIKSKSKSGAVISADICGEKKTGIEIMNAFSLGSPSFDIKAKGDGVVFTVSGSGVPVGMSICGADGMARQGSDRTEILSHYYPDCEISSDDAS